MGLNLIVPIEMQCTGFGSPPTNPAEWSPSYTSLNPSDYDGATYYFEIIAINIDSSDKDIILRLKGGATKATITVPMGTTVPTRFRSSSFVPTAGNQTYVLYRPGTTSWSLVKGYAARIIIVQTNATKTRIQIPIIGIDGYDTSTNIEQTSSTSYIQPHPNYYSLFKKDVSQFANISSWAFEVAINGSVASSAHVTLFNKTDDTQVGSGAVNGLPYQPSLESEDITDEVNFHDLDEFEVRMKADAGNAYLMNASLYVYLTNLSKAEIYQRVARNLNTASTPPNTFEEDRAKIDIDSYSGATVYFEATGYCADDAEIFDLQDDGTDDSGSDGTSKVTNSGINFNSGTQARKRTSTAMTLTDGNRYWGNKESSSANGQWTNALIVIQISTAGEDFFRTIDDGLGIVDVRKKDETYVIAEALGLSDVGIVTDRLVRLAELLGIIDSIGEAYTRIINDVLGITDSVALDRLITLAESLGITDDTTLDRLITIAETLGITDDVSRIVNYLRTQDDSLGVTDRMLSDWIWILILEKLKRKSAIHPLVELESPIVCKIELKSAIHPKLELKSPLDLESQEL